VRAASKRAGVAPLEAVGRRTHITNVEGARGQMAKGRRPAKVQQAESYKHPESESPMRPDVGTQAQFKKKKPPVTYRYDSSLSPALDEIRKHDCVLTPGRYVGAEPQQDDGEPFDEKMKRLAAQWRDQQAEARRLDEAIAQNLKELGYES
jgi:hypothetical protein